MSTEDNLVEGSQRVMRIGHTSAKDMTYSVRLGLDYINKKRTGTDFASEIAPYK